MVIEVSVIPHADEDAIVRDMLVTTKAQSDTTCRLVD